MIYEVMLTLFPGQDSDNDLVQKRVLQELAKSGIYIAYSDISALVCKKKSVDARRGQVKLHLRYAVYIDETPSEGFVPPWHQASPENPVIIVGAGPAGLFAALTLLESGIKPIIIERGVEISKRKRDIADISKTGKINPDSNYCFGEGGAGAFSDGKLYSRSDKRGDISRILSILHYHGADTSILYEARPHIGTDKLPALITQIKNTILSFGGEFHFNTRCMGFVFNGSKICGVQTENTLSGEYSEVQGFCVLLAAGHSADDIYYLVDKTAKDKNAASNALEAKTFAAGVRIEHPRSLIDSIQYHLAKPDGAEAASEQASPLLKNTGFNTVLKSAEYRLAVQSGGRGVYSFCMCPGGFVVPAAATSDQIIINGMSASARNSRWSNAAIVTEIRREDIPIEFGADSLAGLRFRASIEKEAAAQTLAYLKTRKTASGKKTPQSAPAQRLVDFLADRASAALPESSYNPGLVPSRLDLWLPFHIIFRLKEAFVEFNKQMRGFINENAVLIAPETRTSTPVRILRDGFSFESPALPGLFPAGEGSGYAGGIVSSAMDGENAAKAIAARILIKN